jgi:hypothetical protein
VLFSRDMEGGAMLREVLAVHPEVLERAQVVYVADISGMPGLIANTMAIPRIRKRPYPTLLDRKGSPRPRSEQRGRLLLAERGEVMILTTQDEPCDYEVVETLGLVRGNTIRARHVGKDILAGLRTLVGGEITEYTKMLAESREQAQDRKPLCSGPMEWSVFALRLPV